LTPAPGPVSQPDIILTVQTPRLSEELFREPPRSFRPEPFWGLNDRLEENELRRQIGLMASGGWGGFFIHARHGLETPYLGPRYLEAMRAVAEAADERGLRVWLYDEHPFPSGAAGGLVGAASKALRHRVLAVNLHTRLTPIDEAVAYFELRDDAAGLPVDVRRVEPGAESPDASRFLHFYEWEMPVAPTSLANHGNAFIHGFPFADVLNPAAVARFLELTYAAHRDELGDLFGTTLVGAFSDIPCYNWHYGTPHPSVPWTGALPARFEERYGYDLLDQLPSLLLDIGEYHAVRHDFWRLASDLFVHSYTGQIAAWCRANGIAYSAHYWGEEAPHWQVPWAGDVMHHFVHQDVVANDHILRNIDDPAGIKQASTVADQLGKERTLTEIYALSGYNLTFEERKWIGEWAYVLGTNMLVPYIPSYSLRGRRKRDEPPSEFFQQPYWDDEGLINAHFGRLSYALCCGRRVVDALLLQPLSSAQALFRPSAELPPAWRPSADPYEGAGAELFPLGDGFRDVVDWLLAAHCDFHIGNETILAAHGAVIDGRLLVGLGSYELVIVPPSLSWEASTLDLLQQFVAAGGRIVALPPLPTLIEGRPTDGPILPAETETVPMAEDELHAAVAETAGRRVRIVGDSAVLHHYRIDADASTHVLFVVNTSIERGSGPVTVDLLEVPAGHAVEQWDPTTGSRTALEAERDGEPPRLRFDLPPAGSALIVARPVSAGNAAAEPVPADRGAGTRIELAPRWRLKRNGPNVLVLDTCTITTGSRTEGPLPTWRAQEFLRRAGIGTAFGVRFSAEVAALPDQARLAVEDPERYRIVVNGHELAQEGSEAWFDPRLRLIDAVGALRAGTNVIELAGTAGLDTELEPIYLTGEFALSGGQAAFEVGPPVDTVEGSDITREGFPFLVGRPVLEQTVELPAALGRVTLEIDRLDAVVARVRLNGVDCGTLAWKPYPVDLTEAARPGANVLELELATSLHNVFGPLHDRRGEVRHFVIDGVWMNQAQWTDDYFSVPVGVTGATVLVEAA
jgi:hypothetical protein